MNAYHDQFNGLGRDEVERIAAQAQRDVARLNDQLTSVQTRCTELLLENRELRAGLLLPGWTCACGVFNGSMKSLKECRCCGVEKPV